MPFIAKFPVYLPEVKRRGITSVQIEYHSKEKDYFFAKALAFGIFLEEKHRLSVKIGTIRRKIARDCFLPWWQSNDLSGITNH
ncbi:hypothetical protein TW80_10155 [Loktanella sp. S4079]|nr:hypothetical protein TW80_10155 [Loktanella sp. S4079]